MMYVLAIFLPPVAVLFCGRPFGAVLNVLLCLLGWLPGVVHACVVVHDRRDAKRLRRVRDAFREEGVRHA